MSVPIRSVRAVRPVRPAPAPEFTPPRRKPLEHLLEVCGELARRVERALARAEARGLRLRDMDRSIARLYGVIYLSRDVGGQKLCGLLDAVTVLERRVEELEKEARRS